MEGVPHGGCWREECEQCFPDNQKKAEMTKLESAEAILADFKMWMVKGHPWVPGAAFISNPGLDLFVQAALEGYAHTCRVAEQAKPAKRVSLTEVSDGKDAG